MWISRKRWMDHNKESDDLIEKKNLEADKSLKEMLRLSDNRITLRSLDSQLYHQDVKVKTFDIEDGVITMFYPASFKGSMGLHIEREI